LLDLLTFPPKIKPLTEEEKKEKLAELRAKMAEKRSKKAEEETKDAKANELLRRKQGKVKIDFAIQGKDALIARSRI
jgi:UBX domain-containing protein 1/4